MCLSYNLFEEKIWLRGKTPAGVDEAGRGPIAGPVIAAAVVLSNSNHINGLNDSKKLSHNQRERLFESIKMRSVDFSVGLVDSNIIDKDNILRATLQAMEIAVNNLKSKPDFLFIDGNVRTSLFIPQETVIKGDSKCPSIAAASIVAKVYRDTIMEKYHYKYPQYNFIKNKGYPTKEHLNAVKKFGPCPIHRITFNGVTDKK